MISTDADPAAPLDPQASDLPVDGADLAAFVAGKLCHDFISPSGAIVSGLDLMRDPTAQDMRDDALALIEQSARKMVALVHFARVAFGAATTSERFTARELHDLVAGMTDGGRAALDWRIADGEFSKPQARALDIAAVAPAALGKRFEQAGQIVVGDAAAGVGHGKQRPLLALPTLP